MSPTSEASAPSVVVGCDDGAGTRDAVALAARLARPLSAELVLAVAVPGLAPPPASGLRDDQLGEIGAAALRVGRATLAEQRDPPQSRARALAEPAARALIDIARSEDAALVVVGPTHRGTIGRVLPGSTGRKLISESGVPVALAPRGYAERTESRGPARIGVAVDGSGEAKRALEVATGLAVAAGAELCVHLVESPGPIEAGVAPPMPPPPDPETTARILRRQLEVSLEHLNPRPQALSIEEHPGPAASSLLELGPDQVSLMVLGSHGRGSLASWLMGSVSAAVTDLAPWPVLVVTRRMSTPALAAAPG